MLSLTIKEGWPCPSCPVDRLVTKNIMYGMTNVRNAKHNIPGIHNTNLAILLVLGQVDLNWAIRVVAGKFFLVGHGAFEGPLTLIFMSVHDSRQFRSQYDGHHHLPL